jgi:hypothetical protein
MYVVYLKNRGAWIHDGCAAERSLAVLGSCYRALRTGKQRT